MISTGRSNGASGHGATVVQFAVELKFWMLPLRDAFVFAAWLASFFPNRIHWRGQQFYVRNRRLVPVAERHSRPE